MSEPEEELPVDAAATETTVGAPLDDELEDSDSSSLDSTITHESFVIAIEPLIDKKEEKKLLKERKKLEKSRQQFRDFLTREKNFNKVSHDRGWEDWEKWWRQVGVDELREELKAVAQSANRLMDKSEHTVKTMRNLREHADEQYMRNFVKHSELVGYIFDLYKLFRNAAHESYEAEREQLIAKFYKEAFDRDALLDSRKTNFENFVHAATSLTKSRIQQTSDDLIERRVEIESESLIKREEETNEAANREAVACSEIRNLVNFFNNELWPKSRMKEYQQTLAKQLEADKVIGNVQKKSEKIEKEIEIVNEELQNLTREQLAKETNLKSEIQFMTKLLRSGEKKSKREETTDFEKIKHLVKVCDKSKKLLKEKIDKVKKLDAAMKVCAKFEKLNDDLESSEKFDKSSEKFNESFGKLDKSFERLVNSESSDDLSSFENFFKSKSSTNFPTNLTELFFKKLSKVEAEVLLLRRYKEQQLKQADRMKAQLKECEHKLDVQRNLQMLRLNKKKSVGEIYQIAQQIPQIKIPVKMQKKFKLCKSCRDFYGNL